MCKPVAMDDGTSGSMTGVLKNVLPAELFQFLSGVPPSDSDFDDLDDVGLSLGSDAAAANLRLLAWIELLLGDHVFLLKGLCKHHGSALILNVRTEKLKLLVPAYCIATLFRNDTFYKKFLDDLKDEVGESLRVIREDDNPEWKPKEDDLRHAMLLLQILRA